MAEEPAVKIETLDDWRRVTESLPLEAKMELWWGLEGKLRRKLIAEICGTDLA